MANVGNGRVEAGALGAALAEHGVDAACIQQLSARQARAVASVLPHGCLAPAHDGGGLGIALRRPGRAWDPGLPGRPALVARPLEGAGEGALEIVNVHLRGAHALRWRDAAGTRRLQLSSLLGYLDALPETPRLLLGDLNATPRTRTYRELTRRLEDAAARVAARAGHRARPTWGPLASRRWLRIDHVLAGGVEVHDVSPVELPGADHTALLVSVERPALAGP